MPPTPSYERDLEHIADMADAIRRAIQTDHKSVVLSVEAVRDDLVGLYAAVAFADQCGVTLIFRPTISRGDD